MALLLPLALAALAGCQSKDQAPRAAAPAQAAPQAAQAPSGAAQYLSGENTVGGSTVTPKEMSEARSAASSFLVRFERGEFAAIYQDASPSFKQIGSESLFIQKFQQTRQKVGALKNPKEVSFVTRPDKSDVLVYRLENDRFRSDLRLTFARSAQGKLELAGLNQHDEAKK